MGCFSSKQSKSYDLGNSYRESSPYEQIDDDMPLSEQNLRVFGVEQIEYADRRQSSDVDDEIHCRRWNDNDDGYQDTSWRRDENISEGYNNSEDF